jgi:hypothetical protein
MDSYKTFSYLIFLALLTLSLTNQAQLITNFDSIPSNYSINNSNAVQSLNIKYGTEHSVKQIFHLFLPDTLNNHPLVIFIHGGGFIAGSPDIAITNASTRNDVKYFLDRNIAYASVGYRLISTQSDTIGVIKCLNDAKRALQFIRYRSNDLHIDPLKIALTGSSAGAGTSLWLSTVNELADQNASDPVSRESTRVCATGIVKSQATYDIYKWETQVYHDFDGQGTNFTVDSIVNVLGFQNLSNFYGGIDSNYHFLYDPALIQYRQNIDMLSQLSSDDPPIFIGNSSNANHPSQDINHHPEHAYQILQAATAANIVEIKANIPHLNINTTQGEGLNRFIQRNLDECILNTNYKPSKNLRNISLFPNPTNDILNVTSDNEIYSITLLDLQGRIISKQLKINAFSCEMDMSGFGPGYYFIVIEDDLRQVTKRKLVVY